jgi:exopolysaccharide biosynthesis polyprenyl glycosylphosphotransferase
MSSAPVSAGRPRPHLESVPLPLPQRDVRAKRPPALSLLLRLDTLRRLGRVLSLLALDFAGVFLGIYTALVVKLFVRGLPIDRSVVLHETRKYVAFAYLVTALLFARADLYADRPRRPGLSRIGGVLIQVTLVSLVFALANHAQYQSYYLFYGSFLFTFFFVGSFRHFHTQATGFLLSKAGYRRRALLVGSGKHLEVVGNALAEASRSPIEIIGFVSLTPRPDNGLRSLGTLEDLPRVLAQHRVQEVIIADNDFPQEPTIELVDHCHQRGVSVHVAPSTMQVLMHRAELVPGQSVPLFALKPPVFDGFDFALKRVFDVVFSVLILVALAPLLAAIALAIRLGSRGPIVYRSVRPGMGGKPFACLKFRTMRYDAEQRQADLEELNEASGALFKIRHDPRMTKVGRLLRRFSLDELPQLWNVLRGEMSLVGPRPLPLRDFERLDDWHKARYRVLPGITGLWQVSGRSELDFDDLVRLDFVYLERWSVVLDLTIMLKTIPAVFSRRGAF